MSIKINVSFTNEQEKEILVRMFKPLVRAGHKIKIVKGEQYSHIYIMKKKKQKNNLVYIIHLQYNITK